REKRQIMSRWWWVYTGLHRKRVVCEQVFCLGQIPRPVIARKPGRVQYQDETRDGHEDQDRPRDPAAERCKPWIGCGRIVRMHEFEEEVDFRRVLVCLHPGDAR